MRFDGYIWRREKRHMFASCIGTKMNPVESLWWMMTKESYFAKAR